MSCWPPCSGWCDCIDGRCRPAPVKFNAVRIRTPDGRYLRALNGPNIYGGLLGPTSNAPGTWDTFLIDQPTTWPLRTGESMVLRAVNDTWWALPDVLVRVDHGTRNLGKPSKKEPAMVTYQFGGVDRSVLVSPPLHPGYPAYPGNDPGEWTFTITKIQGGNPAPVGTPINNGDQAIFTFASGNPAQPQRSWRLRDDTSPRRVDGDAAPGGPAPTVFTVEFSEVRPDVGWRPPIDTPCRQCASVTAVVTRRDRGTPIASAHVTAQAPSVPFAGNTPAAPSDGRAALTALVDGAIRDCVPAGAITLQAVANRFQIATEPAHIPDQGAFDVPIPMDCTIVTGHVRDSAGSPMAGEWVYLTDPQGNQLVDPDGNPYQTKTDLNGRYQFACVPWEDTALNPPHRTIRISTDRDPSADRVETIGPGGGTFDLTVPLTAATVIVRVLDADTDQPLDGASVRLSPPVPGLPRNASTSGNPPEATFLAVTPPGLGNVRASMTGYIPNTVPAAIPPSATLIIVVKLHRDVAVQTPTAFVMQLDWGTVPRDLDLHCSGPDNAGGRFHCLFSNMQPVPFVRLDVDDRDATGPERITVNQVAAVFVPGDYHCWIDNYSGEQLLANSGASMTLLSLDAMSLPTQRGRWVAADVPGTSDRLWHVVNFTIDAQGQLTVNPVMTYQPGDWATVL